MILPAKGTVTNGFSDDHQAVDIANNFNTPIVAPHAGKITISGSLGDCGLGIEVDGGRFKSRMCHQDKNHVSVGQNVTEGQHIGDMGSTGKSTGSHTHWVLWDNGTRVDGRNYVGVPSDIDMEALDKLYKIVDQLQKNLEASNKSLDSLYKIVDQLQKNIGQPAPIGGKYIIEIKEKL